MLFHVPKGLQLIATGTKVSENTDGKITTTEWKTDVPLPVAGFNLGAFKMKEAKVQGKPGNDLTIDAYANTQAPEGLAHTAELPIAMTEIQAPDAAIGNIDTASLLPMELSQAQVAAQIYTNYFGPLPFARIAVTQQYACYYGQSWPMLVYLPICGFLDKTQQHFLDLSPEDMYWKQVTPHEVAHQWWGQTVGFRSYRDQWMSEGFADASASIFMQLTRPKPDEFREFWKYQLKLITEKNAYGFRPNDVGPVTMGYRLNTHKTGENIARDLIYPKGAYILHMIRMMMWTSKEGDDRFKATMHDLVDTYRLQAATTEDFKAIVEKHMSPQMDLDGNKKMDWFFNQYVYGTGLPSYHFDGQITETSGGESLHIKLIQSGVSPTFKMLVPIYLEFADGKVTRLGSIHVTGPKTLEQTVNLPKFQAPVKRVLINYYYDVLAIEN
jgi:aminopeptidase N